MSENEELRNILSKCATAIGNGSMASPDCSLEFFGHLPSEISAETKALRRKIAQAQEVLRDIGLKRQAEGFKCFYCDLLRGHTKRCKLAAVLESVK